MKSIVSLIVLMLIVAAGAALLFPKQKNHVPLHLLAGGGLRPAVEKLAAAFETKTGIPVEPDYGGSGLILSRARKNNGADLFFPGDAWYVDRLQQLDSTVAKRSTVAWFVPVIIVGKGNPKEIYHIDDLARPGLRIGLGDAKACQVGRVAQQILDSAGVHPPKDNLQYALTVNELGVWVTMKNVDAAIVWDAIAATMADAVDAVAIAPEKTVNSEVVLARLTHARSADDADAFLRFVSGSEGATILRAAGYRTEKP